MKPIHGAAISLSVYKVTLLKQSSELLQCVLKYLELMIYDECGEASVKEEACKDNTKYVHEKTTAHAFSDDCSKSSDVSK